MPTTAGPQKPARRNAAGLQRDLDLLELLASPEGLSAGGLGVSRVAQLAGRDKAVISRTLATLADAGLVERDPETLQYRLGHQLYALAARTREAQLVTRALPYLRRVVRATHETTHLCVLRAGTVLTLVSEMSEYAFRGVGWEGVSTAAWNTSAGRVLVSGWTEQNLREWYSVHGHDRAITSPAAPTVPAFGASSPAEPIPGTSVVTDVEAFLAEITRIRRQGYAKVDEEFEAGVVGVSAPVFDFRGTVIAAFNVSAPKHRLAAHLDAAGRVVTSIARELSEQMGAPEGGARPAGA
ncbi:IclR family transcriptional regulator [Microcella daejeonensis]|uniref:IclR family transcriptional regulator n=1 Tax=Microcella daejeonensis TaxID=2994971 RepID=A0A9E8S9S6_9MICO|nr:IclR family transcriptional regulator [Microcella daejeonensis]WAB82354.1 IclR family transcriptional regulator [Microcella daejeonensis]WAB84532.1 IclR family transcriptional regulator [Microcella daejeonensis]